jgi:hypothetical protein
MKYENALHYHRHAAHAFDDFEALRRKHDLRGSLVNSISHHLRHFVYRTGLELPKRDRRYVRRK